MPLVLTGRAALVALCVAGIAASLIAYDSNRKIEQGVRTVVAGGGDAATVRTLDDARTRLNPDSLRENSKAIALARTGRAADAEAIMLDVVRREPENQLPWIVLARVQVTLGERDDARRSHARALALNSQTPRAELPPPLEPGKP